MRAILLGCGWLLIAGAVALTPALSRAAGDHPEAAKPEVGADSKPADAVGHGGHGPIDPAKELLSPRADLGLWTLVVFALLLAVLWRFAWGPMLEGLKKREDFIVEHRAQAARDRADAEALLAQVKAQLASAHDQARGILDEARKDAEALRVRMDADARAAVQADRERLLREIETARDQALADLYNRSVQLATLVSAKAIGRELGGEDHRRLLDEALVELDAAGKAGAFAGSEGGRA